MALNDPRSSDAQGGGAPRPPRSAVSETDPRVAAAFSAIAAATRAALCASTSASSARRAATEAVATGGVTAAEGDVAAGLGAADEAGGPVGVLRARSLCARARSATEWPMKLTEKWSAWQ
jgi:hypothetical protein